MQRIHNSAGRLILHRPRSDSTSLAAHATQSQILVLTYKTMHNEASVYLCELMCPNQAARALHSASSNSLEVKRTRIKAGGCSFTVAAASQWNMLPNFIKTSPVTLSPASDVD